MSKSLIIVSGGFSLFVIILIIYLIRKENLNIKYSLVWIILFPLLFLSLVIPGLLEWVTHFLGFQMASNMVLSILIALLVIINIINTVINSHQDKKIRLLIQEISIFI